MHQGKTFYVFYCLTSHFVSIRLRLQSMQAFERIKQKMGDRKVRLCSFVAGMKKLAYSRETEFAKAL